MLIPMLQKERLQADITLIASWMQAKLASHPSAARRSRSGFGIWFL
jgi:hypothetical protein